MVSKRGMTIFARSDSPRFDDMFVIGEIFDENNYHIDSTWVEGGTVVDIGLNIGCFSLLCYSMGACRIIGFEPEPHNLEIARMNIEVNEAVIELIPYAVGYPRTTYMDNGSGHSQVGREYGSPIQVVDINQYLDPIEVVDLLKIDCEGGEIEFFETISDENLRKVRRIVGELHPFIEEKHPEKYAEMITKMNTFFAISRFGHLDSAFTGVWK